MAILLAQETYTPYKTNRQISLTQNVQGITQYKITNIVNKHVLSKLIKQQSNQQENIRMNNNNNVLSEFIMNECTYDACEPK